MLNNIKLTKIRNKIIDFAINKDLDGYQEYIETLSKIGDNQYLQTILINDYNINCNQFDTIKQLKKNTFNTICLLSCVNTEQKEIDNILNQHNLIQIGKNIIVKSGTYSGKHLAKIEVSDINTNSIYYTSQFIYNFKGDRDLYSKIQLYSVTYSYVGTYSNGNWITNDLKIDITDNVVTTYNNGIVLTITTYSNPIPYISKYEMIINSLTYSII
jgi:hypothetical protein